MKLFHKKIEKFDFFAYNRGGELNCEWQRMMNININTGFWLLGLMIPLSKKLIFLENFMSRCPCSDIMVLRGQSFMIQSFHGDQWKLCAQFLNSTVDASRLWFIKPRPGEMMNSRNMNKARNPGRIKRNNLTKAQNLCEQISKFIISIDLEELKELSCGLIAEKFGVSSPYLSRVFKDSVK